MCTFVSWRWRGATFATSIGQAYYSYNTDYEDSNIPTTHKKWHYCSCFGVTLPTSIIAIAISVVIIAIIRVTRYSKASLNEEKVILFIINRTPCIKRESRDAAHAAKSLRWSNTIPYKGNENFNILLSSI